MILTHALPISLRVFLLTVYLLWFTRAAILRKERGQYAGGIWYYSVLSSLSVMLLTAAYLALSVVSLFTGAIVRLPVLEIAHFAVAVNITVLLLVFWFGHVVHLKHEYLQSANHLLMHTLAPVLFLVDFFLFDRIVLLSAPQVLWCLSIPLFYSVQTFTHAAVNPKLRFRSGRRYPYFFMDADTLGWFRIRKPPGVIWWTLLGLGLTLGLGYLFNFLLSVL